MANGSAEGDDGGMTPRIVSVNVGTPQQAAWDGSRVSAIHKHGVVEPVLVTTVGLTGDQVADTRHHGGLDQAVYAFAREDLDRWGELFGQALPDGHFGENLTTLGIDVNEAEVGERWRVGSAVFEVAEVRIPCNDFKGWLGATGYDNRGWVKRFTSEGRPGPYLRVVEEGILQVGDELEVVHRPGHGVTVGLMFRALTTESRLLPDLLRVDNLAAKARRRAEQYVATLGD